MNSIAKSGYVYFVYIPDKFEAGDRLFKIGSTSNINKRLMELQVGSPYQLKVFGSYKSVKYRTIEQGLHDYFFNEHVSGEWFTISKEKIEILLNGLAEIDKELDSIVWFPETPEKWLLLSWKKNPKGTKKKWCDKHMLYKINKHIFKNHKNLVGSKKSKAEYDYFIELYYNAEKADQVRKAWKKEQKKQGMIE